MNTAWAIVEEVERERPGIAWLRCRLDAGPAAPAVAYSALSGPVATGDRVLLNTTAVNLGLGSGGVHFVVANLSNAERALECPGHIIKLRYTPVQTPVLSVEEPDSPWHERLKDADSLEAMPVVCCELLSQAPGVIAGCRTSETPLSLAAVVTDEAALPVAFSNLLADLRESGFLSTIVTAGQAFGGDLEAVNVHSGLLAARAAGADVAIVTPGPGTVGTGTRWGFGGVAQGQAMNAAFALGGRPVGVVRASTADTRERHQGISHHTKTVFERVALCPFHAAIPAEAVDIIREEFHNLAVQTGHRMSASVVNGCMSALNAFEHAWKPWGTMGRNRADDPVFYEASAAAGILATRLQREKESTVG